MDDAQRTSTWRDKYKVHPAADVFPLLPDAELDALGADIKANGLTIPVLFWRNGKDRVLIDGRNRLEAMNRVGLDPLEAMTETFTCKDPITHIISLNLHRRHMLKSERAAAIVALAKIASENKPDHGDPVSKGGRGKRSAVKAKALEINSALPKEQQVSEPTIKRAIARAEGKTPEPKRYAARPMPKPRSGKPVVGIDAARRHYLDLCANVGVDLDAEQKIVFDALLEIAGKRALNGGKPQSPASALPQGGRSEDGSL